MRYASTQSTKFIYDLIGVTLLSDDCGFDKMTRVPVYVEGSDSTYICLKNLSGLE